MNQSVGHSHHVVLVGADGSDGGYLAVAEAAEFCREYGAHLFALSVEERLPKYAATMGEVDDFTKQKDKYFTDVQARAIAIAKDYGVELQHEVRVGHAAESIIQYGEEIHADLIVLGYHGHSRITELLIGTTAHKVNVYSTASVFIVKDRGEAPRTHANS